MLILKFRDFFIIQFYSVKFRNQPYSIYNNYVLNRHLNKKNKCRYYFKIKSKIPHYTRLFWTKSAANVIKKISLIQDAYLSNAKKKMTLFKNKHYVL